MSLRKYGIYLAYPPTVDLRGEGLGRYLASLLKGASHEEDVEFVIVCPSWSRETLTQLLKSEQVPERNFTIEGPVSEPYILRAYRLFESFTKKRRIGRPSRWLQRIQGWSKKIKGVYRYSAQQLVSVNGPLSFVWFFIQFSPLLLLSIALVPLAMLVGLALMLVQLAKNVQLKGRYSPGGLRGLIARHFPKVLRALDWVGAKPQPKDSLWVYRLFRLMHAVEARRMQRLIEAMNDVRAWYSPAAFWPEFNAIQAPRLLCLPDVVLEEFPVGFTGLGGLRLFEAFENVQASIRSAHYVVTYSNHIKWETAVGRYGVLSSNVAVIPHAPSVLDRWITISGFERSEETSRRYCQTLVKQLFHRSGSPYLHSFGNADFPFIFYASQFRPNKNVLTLLRAYSFLVRRKFIPHKLVLTGTPGNIREIADFLVINNLGNEVLCLPGMSVSELASFYKLADLAVNPSLSEGGCPFTFTEALSVGTPVVMANIPVTTEVLTDPELQQATLFDPYDWRDMADRIEWALNNRDQLLTVQRRTYEQLISRTWTDVAREHLDILDRISQQPVIGHA